MTPEEISEARKLAEKLEGPQHAMVLQELSSARREALSRALDALEQSRGYAKILEADCHDATCMACPKCCDALSAQLSEVREELRQAEVDRAHMELQRDEARSGTVETAQDGAELAAALRKENEELKAQKSRHMKALRDYDDKLCAAQAREEKLREALDRMRRDRDQEHHGAQQSRAERDSLIETVRVLNAKLSALASTKPAETRRRCSGCGNEIDDEVCHCGEYVRDHGHGPTDVDGHPPVPMGCDCLRAKPSETEPKRCWYVSELDGAQCAKDAGHGGLHHIADDLRAPSGTERSNT